MSALPLISDVDLLRNRKGVIHLDAKVANRALDRGADGSQITGAAVDQRRLGSAKRVGAEDVRV
jgi:hypothetical protein